MNDMNVRGVPVALADPNASIYNALEWQEIQRSVANSQFTALEIKAFYVIGLIFEICESVDCLLKAESPSKIDHSVAYQVYTSGGRYLPAFGIFASGIELLGRCLTGNETVDVNENLNVGFHYIAKPNPLPLLSSIPMSIEVVKANQSYSIQDLIDLRNYAAHGQTTVGEKDPNSNRRIPKSNLSGIERDLFGKLPAKMEQAINIYWSALLNDKGHCGKLAKARIDVYPNRIGPLRHVINYFGQIPYQSAGSLFGKFSW